MQSSVQFPPFHANRTSYKEVWTLQSLPALTFDILFFGLEFICLKPRSEPRLLIKSPNFSPTVKYRLRTKRKIDLGTVRTNNMN
jgi:hypothetical protein